MNNVAQDEVVSQELELVLPKIKKYHIIIFVQKAFFVGN